MFTIILLVLLFLLIAYISHKSREGLMNQYTPINVTDENLNIYTDVLTNPSNSLFDQKYVEMNKEDVLLDMKYFNNATNILFAYKAKNFGI
jgi:hypothetical protein